MSEGQTFVVMLNVAEQLTPALIHGGLERETERETEREREREMASKRSREKEIKYLIREKGAVWKSE